jgi:hypothetical protein
MQCSGQTVCGIDKIKRQCGFNLDPALWANTAVVTPATTAKHLAEQIANVGSTHVVAIKPKRTGRLTSRATVTKRCWPGSTNIVVFFARLVTAKHVISRRNLFKPFFG